MEFQSLSKVSLRTHYNILYPTKKHTILTPFTSFGMNEGISLALLKNTKSAFDTAVTKLAIILLVFIATSIELELSPITDTGVAKLNLF